MTTKSLLTAFAGTLLIGRDRLNEPDAVSVVLGSGIERLDVIVVQRAGRLTAYVNECPHAFTTLETFDGRFLDADDPSLLVCSTHGARFRVADGVCVEGPCLGKRLTPVPIDIVGKEVRLGGRA